MLVEKSLLFAKNGCKIQSTNKKYKLLSQEYIMILFSEYFLEDMLFHKRYEVCGYILDI